MLFCTYSTITNLLTGLRKTCMLHIVEQKGCILCYCVITRAESANFMSQIIKTVKTIPQTASRRLRNTPSYFFLLWRWFTWLLALITLVSIHGQPLPLLAALLLGDHVSLNPGYNPVRARVSIFSACPSWKKQAASTKATSIDQTTQTGEALASPSSSHR